MSYLTSTWLRPAASLIAVVAITALWLMGASATEAGDPGSVVITPTPAQVGVGGTTTVSVDVTAPDEGLSVWIIEIGYDPAVVQVDTSQGNPVCTAPEIPGTNFQASSCDTKSVPPGGTHNRAVAFGAWVLNSGGNATGWTGTRTVATFTFRAVGAAGQNSPLTVTVCSDCFLRPNTSQADPTETNGLITIIEGTPQIWGNSDCSADGIRSRDAQATGKFVLQGTPLTQTEPCPDIGSTVTINGTQYTWGNWDCSADGVRSRDAQATGKFVLQGTPLTQTEPCPDIGATVTVS